MPITNDKIFVENERGEIFSIEDHFIMVSNEARKLAFEFNGYIQDVRMIAGYTKIAPWAMRDLFPCEYKAKRWIKRAKKIGKILQIKRNFESWTRGMKVNRQARSYLIREAIKFRNEPLKIEFFEKEDINKIRPEIYFHRQIKTSWF